MSNISPALQREVDRKTKDAQERYMTEPDETSRVNAEAKIRRELEAAGQAAVIAEELGKLAMGSGTRDYLVVALSTEHRTILGQIIRSIAEAVVATTDDVQTHGYCPGADRADQLGTSIMHARHDPRLTCQTVAGATLSQGQPII